MKRGAILTLARQAGMAGLATTVVCEIDELERFAELVAAEERKACAAMLDAEAERLDKLGVYMEDVAHLNKMAMMMRSNAGG